MKVNYENTTGLFCVIGDPVGHSLSPLLHNTMIAALGRDDLYLAIAVKAAALGDFVAAAKTMGFGGFNLTMPHKENILPYLSSQTPQAAQCGSVNSVRLRDGRLEGHSTDGMGFLRGLRDLDLTVSGQRVTILGAGGAAKSIAMSAAAAGAKQVTVANRTLEKAQRLVAGQGHMAAAPLGALEEILPETDLFINTTPVGMAGTQGEFPFLRALRPGGAAADCIYAPAMTPFMAAAKALGHPVCNGIGMLVYQAIYAYDFFRDLKLDEETVGHLGRLLLEKSGVDPRGC